MIWWDDLLNKDPPANLISGLQIVIVFAKAGLAPKTFFEYAYVLVSKQVLSRIMANEFQLTIITRCGIMSEPGPRKQQECDNLRTAKNRKEPKFSAIRE